MPPCPERPPSVTEITFELVVDGHRKKFTFLRPHKIADLLVAEDVTLGQWLRGLRDVGPQDMTPPPTPTGKGPKQ